MRMLHVVPTYFPAVRYGGPVVSVHGLCKALVRRGHEVHVYTTNVDGREDSQVPLGKPVDLDGVNVWYFPVPLARRLYWSPRMGRALRQQMSSFDILHTHSVFLWPTWAAARAAARNAVPYVVSPRGMLVADLIERKSRLAKTAWIRVIERSNLKHAAAVHATSPLEADEMRALGVPLPPIRVVPNGVELAPSGMGKESCGPEIVSLTNEAPYLLYIGRINWKKGLDRLIAAMVHLPNIDLLVAGNDEEAYQPTLEAMVSERGLANRVRFLGPRYGADKQVLLEHAAALVLPSYSENFGNVVLEAMVVGCPVVVTPEVGVAAIVRETGAGCVLEGEPRALAAGIADLLSSPDRMADMRRRGMNAVLEHFTWDAVAAEMERLYAECATHQVRNVRALGAAGTGHA